MLPIWMQNSEGYMCKIIIVMMMMIQVLLLQDIKVMHLYV
jgi:hypothetical protein